MAYLSKEKFKELEVELKNLKNDGRREIAERLDEAKSFGDLSENAEYHQAREDQGKMEARILELEELLKTAEIVKTHHSGVVELGSVVEVAKKGFQKTQTFEITGKEDADVLAGKIDIEAPLAKAMLGKKVEETFEFKKPNGESIAYRIVSIK
jgi:transcription elongation factor GreA